jgi:hypothetical protein
MVGCALVAGAVLQGIGARTAETDDAGAVALDENVPATPAAVATAPYAVAAGK